MDQLSTANSLISFLTTINMMFVNETTKAKGFHMDSEVLFRMLLAVSRQRDVSLEAMLTHELAAVPPSLFHDDGGMRKCTKSDLAKKLEAKADSVEQELPETAGETAYVIDGMALL